MLGFDARTPGLPCTVSVPNLNTDRPFRLGERGVGLNVRRLMYQPLIWAGIAGDEACRLLAPLDPEDLQGLADALVDGVRRDSKPDRDFLGGMMLVDEPEAVQLTLGQPRDPRLEISSAIGAGRTLHTAIPKGLFIFDAYRHCVRLRKM